MKITTKDKILDGSRAYFNQHGFGASSLYQIAQSINISRGNLAYHFPDKESILEVHLMQMEQRSKDSFTTSFLIASWETLKNTSKDFIQVQKDFNYIFFDKQLLFLPRVQEKIQAIRKIHLKIQMSMIHVSIQSGNMKQEPIKGVYYNISRSIWQILFFHLVARRFADQDDADWDKVMWSLLLPHFTKKGRDSFINHFGEDYFQSLGMAHQTFIGDNVTF